MQSSQLTGDRSLLEQLTIDNGVASSGHEARCFHCGKRVPGARLLAEKTDTDKRFCCSGCESVYLLLSQSDLCAYYDLRKIGRDIRSSAQSSFESPEISEGSIEYDFLDTSDFRLESGISSQRPILKFFLSGVHCTACLWLVERLPKICDGVESARLDLGTSILKLELKSGEKFSPACLALQKIGYRPYPVLSGGEAEKIEEQENRSFLYRISVAAVCSGNVMLLSISLYAGATGGFATFFRWLALLVTAPAFLYSARPFYQSAWKSIRGGTLSIDVPVSLALILGYLASAFAVIRGSGEIYLDSLTGLIFLLLSSRYFLKRLQQKRLGASGLMDVLSPSTVNRIDSKTSSETQNPTSVSLKNVRPGDWIQILQNEVVPVDGILMSVSGKGCRLDFSLLTGESAPVLALVHSAVFAGVKNLDGTIVIQATTAARDSRLGKIVAGIELSGRAANKSLTIVDRAARYFVAVTLVLALGVLAWKLGSDPLEGFRRALCLIIVACPCALALATPLALTRSYETAARGGILLKDPEILDALATVKNIYIDKTGTLTEGRPQVVACEMIHPNRPVAPLYSAVYSLESQSRHPIARSLSQHFEDVFGVTLKPVQNFLEKSGSGVSGEVAGHVYQIGRLDNFESTTGVGVYEDGVLQLRITLQDTLRKDSKRAVQSLLKSGYSVHILSGDSEGPVRDIARGLELPMKNVHFGISPEEKARIVSQDKSSVMIGDGANDALALSEARVGIAVQGSLEISLRAADAFASLSGLPPVVRVLEVARETRKLLIRNYSFSLIYNLFGAVLAISGHIGPLFAAFVMPISAATVFISSQVGTKRLRQGGQRP